ncbi:MAG: 30S ribosomal protein S15 [Nanoarchaeota archaeon]
MARMYSRKRGKAGSTRPSKAVVQQWIRYKGEEIEKLIVKLYKGGNSISVIGMILRDTYGIPSVRFITKKRIATILKTNGLSPKLPEDMTALIKKDIRLVKHLDAHKKDMTVWRGLTITESKINKLAKYYKREGVLQRAWKFDRKTAKLLVE